MIDLIRTYDIEDNSDIAQLLRVAAIVASDCEIVESLPVDQGTVDQFFIFGKQLTTAKNDIEIWRKKKIAPFKAEIDQINSACAPITDGIDTLRNKIKTRIDTFEKEQQAERAAAAIVAAIKNEPIAPQPVKAGPPLKRVQKIGADIFDASLLPRKFLQPDEAKILAAIKLGVEIPGVRRIVKEVLSY